MIPLSAEEAQEALGLGSFPGPVDAVSIDTRTIRPGDVFVALRGERFDGHAFVAQALEAGASTAIVSESWRDGPDARELPLALSSRITPVTDTLEALGGLARAVRRKSGAKVIAVTGSVGKTSTKDLITAMACRVGRVVSTSANQNNEIGVPLTLLSMAVDTEVAVVEMGMRAAGQIAALERIAEPDVGVVTNVHPVHLELLGSLEDIAQAKAELIVGLRAACTAVVPFDCTPIVPYLAGVRCRTLRFALGPGNDQAEVWGLVTDRARGGGGAVLTIRWPESRAEVEIPFASRHRLENAMAAVAACYGTGLAVADCLPGLRDVVFTPARGDVVQVGPWSIIDDTYNANPAAVRAALDDLVDMAGQRGGRPVAVLGDMLELGPEEAYFHEECGAYAAEAGVQVLWGVGPRSRFTEVGFARAAQGGQRAGHVETVEDVDAVLAALRPGDVILFKASRSVRLETMVSALLKAAASATEAPGQTSEGDAS